MNFSKKIINTLKRKNINFFTGVPDSVLKGFCDELIKFKNAKHIIAANEGGAISLAAGYYLARKRLPVVYLQKFRIRKYHKSSHFYDTQRNLWNSDDNVYWLERF